MWEFNFGSCSGKWIATFKTVILVEGSCLLFVLWVSATCCFLWEVLKGTEGIRASVDSLWGRLDHKDILCECVVCVCYVLCLFAFMSFFSLRLSLFFEVEGATMLRGLQRSIYGFSHTTSSQETPATYAI